MDFKEVFTTIAPTLKDIAISYVKKDKNTDNLTWLTGTLNKYVPQGMKEGLTSKTSQEILSTIETFAENMVSIEKASENRKSKEVWFQEFINNNESMSAQQKEEYIRIANLALSMGNEALIRIMKSPKIVNLNEETNRLMQEAENLNAANGSADSKLIAKQILLSNANGIDIFSHESDYVEGEELFPQPTLESPQNSVMDEGLKMIAAAALKACAASGKIPFLSKVLPIGAVTNIACVGVESVKCMYGVATGKMNANTALENIGRASVAAIADCCASGLPAKFLAPISVVGPVMSLVVGSCFGSLSGQAVQEKVFSGFKAVKNVAKAVAPTIAKSLMKIVFSKNQIKIPAQDI